MRCNFDSFCHYLKPETTVGFLCSNSAIFAVFGISCCPFKKRFCQACKTITIGVLVVILMKIDDFHTCFVMTVISASLSNLTGSKCLFGKIARHARFCVLSHFSNIHFQIKTIFTCFTQGLSRSANVLDGSARVRATKSLILQAQKMEICKAQ